MAYIPVQNQSVSGTVGASVIGLPPVNLNVGGNPVTTSNPVAVQPPASGHLDVIIGESTNSSVISISKGSIAAVIVGGSIAASFTPPANQSVSGTVQAQLQSTNASIITVGGAAGTQYSEFQTVPSVTGTAVMFKKTASSSLMSAVTPDAPLPILANFYPGTIDSFGHFVTGSPYNQIDVPFFSGTPAALVTVTTAGGGSAISSVGGAVFATGTGVTANARGVTNQTIAYRGGSEVYAFITAAFTTPTDANSFQRAGLYNDQDGFFFGYEGTSFGVTVRNNAADVTVAAANFNKDTLTGGANSLFTRDGKPEAIDYTKLNVYRIRFGWLGAAPIEYEVLSPDGQWVTFHVVREPNLYSVPSIENPNLPVTMHVSKTGADATDLKILTGCWAAGTTTALSKIGDTTITSSTLAGLTRAVITGETTAGGGGFVNVKVNPAGTLETNATVTQSGTWRVSVAGIPSISGTVNVGNFPTTQNVSGSVVAFPTGQYTVVSSISGGIFPVSGSVAATITNTNVNVSGSVVAFGFPTNQNVSGSVVAFQGTSPWITVPTSGSVIANQGGTRITSLVSTVPSSVIVGASIFGTVPVTQVTSPWLTVPTSGSVTALQGGTVITSLVSTVPSSVIVGTSIFGQLPAGTAVLGSVATLQGTNPWITVPTSGSVTALQGGTRITSVVGSIPSSLLTGSYGQRNDAVASFLGGNLTWTPKSTDSAGRTLTKPFAPEEARVEGYHSVVSTSVTTLVAAAGAGLRNYITDVVIANTGATTTLITFRSGGGTSVLGYGIAPAGGGSNMLGFATPMRTLANETFDFQPTSASSILYVKVSGFKAP